ncbi:hypothetical protein [Vibrio parahaemolyticus]|uniref:hypothetical protein n=1 Tax=Vibrio parahaemolyticus TaxID=670 RepID=UPI0031CC7556
MSGLEQTNYSKLSNRLDEIHKEFEKNMTNPDVDIVAPLLSETLDIDKTLRERINQVDQLRKQLLENNNNET